MAAIDTVIFDLGNVLVDWSPAYLYKKMIADEKDREYFLSHVATMDWHSEQDAGRSPQEGTEALVKEHPGWAHPIRAFYTRWKEMFGGPIEGSVQILKELKEKGHRLYALSNWNAELFNQSVNDYPFLQWFDDKIISGEAKLKKPDAAIFQLLFNRFNVNPAKAVFIDDSAANIETARSLGLHCVHFKNPGALRRDLQALHVL